MKLEKVYKQPIIKEMKGKQQQKDLLSGKTQNHWVASASAEEFLGSSNTSGRPAGCLQQGGKAKEELT